MKNVRRKCIAKNAFQKIAFGSLLLIHQLLVLRPGRLRRVLMKRIPK
jgi:hypothetical protein